jgi:hypothetical protein
MTEGEIRLPPNWICYPEAFEGLVDEKGRWLGKGLVPRCRVCRGWLQPEENHKCPGYMPRMDRLQPMDLEQRRAIRTSAKLAAGDWDDDHFDPTTPGDTHPVVRYGEEWDDDHYDHTTPGEIDLEYRSEYEDSGVLLEGWDEDRWIVWRRQQLGHSKDYDPEFDLELED